MNCEKSLSITEEIAQRPAADGIDPEALIRKQDRKRPERIPMGSSRNAAVLIPLIRKEEWHILFEIRKKGIRQGGDVCFPGGMMEEGETPEETAVREASEELLIDPDTITVLAPMHITTGPAGTDTTSVIGVIRDYRGTYSDAEVERVFTIPLSWFLEHPADVHEVTLHAQAGPDFPYDLVPGGKDYRFIPMRQKHYFYQTEEAVIWGLTAKLLSFAVELLRKWMKT